LQNIADPAIIALFIKYSPLPDAMNQQIVQMLMQKAQQPPQMSPRDQAKTQIEAVHAQADIESKRAGAIANLAKAGIQGPGPGEQLMQQAVDALVASGQSAQDHAEQLRENEQQHQHALIQQQQQHAQAVQQAAQQNAHAMQQNQQQADLAPPQNSP